VGSGAGGLRRSAATTEPRRASGPLWRSLGLPWLIGLLVIPLLIAAIGHGAYDRPRSANGPQATASPSSTSGAPKFSLAPLSIARSGNSITLTGDFPDDTAKAVLMKALKGALPAGVNIVDRIQLNPDVDALDFSNAAPLFKDSAPIADFNVTVNGDTVTLAGTAASQDQKNAVDQDAVHIWSHLNVVDNLTVNGSAPQPGSPCANLQSAVNAAMGRPITFDSNGFGLAGAYDQGLTQVADKLKACPTAHATINGYTDNIGSEATNILLSNQRAEAVDEFLLAHGVAGNQLAVQGLGSANPVASNDTPDGRAKNRRVEIAVS